MRQSVRIVRQCLDNMPSGPYKADHPLTTPPPKDRTLKDIETLITHFLQVSWGPVIPAGEASVMIEATKGLNSYYLTRSEEHTSELQSLMRISYAVFCLKKKKKTLNITYRTNKTKYLTVR